MHERENRTYFHAHIKLLGFTQIEIKDSFSTREIQISIDQFNKYYRKMYHH